MKPTIKLPLYDKFRCTQDKCNFHCCRDWRITVDDETYSKWENQKLACSDHVLTHYTYKDENDYLVALNAKGLCPFLNGKGLCQLVIEKGEDYLSKTCTTFPRQINEEKNWTEYALDFGCPAVIDLFYQEKDLLSPIENDISPSHKQDLLYQVRACILALLKTTSLTLPKRLMIAFFALLDIQEQKGVKAKKATLDNYASENYLLQLAQEIDGMTFHKTDAIWERNELLLDVLQCYRQEEMYGEYINHLAEYATALESRFSDTQLETAYQSFEKAYHPYEILVTNYLLTEIFVSGLKEIKTLEKFIMRYEWIALEYSVLKHALFLKYLQNQLVTLDYALVRDYMMIISRIAGYNQEDIENYLKESFENPLFDWGYLALIVGNDLI